MIPYARQSISDEDVQAVVAVLRSDWLTQGPAIDRFEKAVAEYCGAKHAVAVSSGTAALHVACLAAGLGHGDVLWTSPNSFVASANCALYCGARVEFVDIDARTYNLSVELLEAKLVAAERAGSLPKVVVPVHFAGQSCEMERIGELAERYGFTVLEDASHAVGGTYRGVKVGACLHSEMTVLSFHPVKIITTGEGGMVLTNRDDLAERLRLLRTHGITRDPELMEGTPHGDWYYEQVMLGYNYRITDIQAALGASQLERIDAFVMRRHALAARYDEALAGLPVTTPWQHPDAYSAFHLYPIRVPNDKGRAGRKEVFDRLRAAGVNVNVHYIPIHTQPFYRKMGYTDGDFPEAEAYYSEAISLPMYASLTDEEQDRVQAALAGAVA